MAGYEFGLFPDDSGRDDPLFLWASDDPAADLARAVALGATTGMDPVDTGDGIVVASFIDPFGNEFGLIRNPHFSPQLVEAGADDVSDRSITITGHVPVSPGEAYSLWATSDGLAKWWTENNEVDLRPGGKYEIHFMPDAAPGDKGGDWCRVLSFLPGKMLSFTWNAPPHLKTRPLHTWVVMLFTEADSGTTVELNHLGWPDSGLVDFDSDWLATFQYFEDAWPSVMERFVSHFGQQ
jgi:uncharacterized protein YndB with AHSA1/START domain